MLNSAYKLNMYGAYYSWVHHCLLLQFNNTVVFSKIEPLKYHLDSRMSQYYVLQNYEWE